MVFENSLDTLCAALSDAIGIEPPKMAAEANRELVKYVTDTLSGEKADRIFMFNPDAIGAWISEKYASLMPEVREQTDIELPLKTVMPSVTPVCYGTMYTGAQPSVHGIRKYEKPVIKIDSIFDALIRAGKKPVILATEKCSMSLIYLEREMDYFILKDESEVNAKAAELIMEDKYDFYAVYNGNYDSVMHKNGPESPLSLAELSKNSASFSFFCELIKRRFVNHNTLVGFAMDHGCHEIDGGCGSHGLDMDEDINITHFYKIIPRK